MYLRIEYVTETEKKIRLNLSPLEVSLTSDNILPAMGNIRISVLYIFFVKIKKFLPLPWYFPSTKS